MARARRSSWQDARVTRAELEAWCRDRGLVISADGWSRLERLVELWRQYGRAINLMGGIERETLWEHVREALLGVELVDAARPEDMACRWVDVGSGGGLPGLVVAAVRPWEVVLIEPRARRAAFLDLALASVAMGSGRLIRARWSVSTWNEYHLGSQEPRPKVVFFVLSSRAVFAPEIWLREAESVDFPRGITLCHVESSTLEVAGRRPTSAVRDGRWAVLGFSAGRDASEAEPRATK